MKAIQFQPGKSYTDADVAIETEIPTPTATGQDILVKVTAVGLNPVDTKVLPDADEEAKTVGYDGLGIIESIGDQVTLFQPGDRVYYAGDITRPGSNAEYQLVDARIAAKAPTSLDDATAVALPLTALTAWESLFDRLLIDIDSPEKNQGKSLLIIGGAGGVGSIAIQLAKLAGLTVIATASREESAEWCKKLGADFTVNHRESMPEQLKQVGFETVNYIANFNSVDQHWNAMGEIIAPQGKVVLITEHNDELNMGGMFKTKSVTICWELMFTRSIFTTDDIQRQHEILTRVAELIDTGKISTTSNKTMTPINATNIIEAHKQIDTQTSIGKLTLYGW